MSKKKLVVPKVVKKEVLIPIKINIRYKYSMNKFEENFGENIYYSQIEQESYIELKDFLMTKLNRKIKFRKRGRDGMVLSLRADMYNSEFEEMLIIIKTNNLGFTYDFTISKAELLTEEELAND